MIVTESTLLKHANEVYTIGAYRLFEEHFMKFPKYCQGLVAILDKYIFKRWTKDIDISLGSSSIGDVEKVSEKDIASYSALRREMLKKFSDMISANELNINAWECIPSEVEPYYVDNSKMKLVLPTLKFQLEGVQKENEI
ncbi:hypothetical protein M9H77_18693 [Catharanthus roseus]|uniref:Uncharacterized protein n=1 Tax=Catharanthus roseus TaxID=4058 RepID=A0ACC0B863_CATRO|nr:hypothetical protein M9H77_18693 [Catharanthus roseus]